jgi:synaptotagmin-4
LIIFRNFQVIPAILGLTLAAILAVAACFCARRVRHQQKKSYADAAFPFQPTSRPTRAVRSPSGTGHYLKKSPSPTTATKPLPGTLSPNDALPPQTTMTKYSEENEMSLGLSMMSNSVTSECEQQCNDEFGKLGSLVFKLRYLIDRNALVVSIVRCKGLPSRISNGSALITENVGQLQSNGKTTSSALDPYVKLQILPEKQHKVKTRLECDFLGGLMRN